MVRYKALDALRGLTIALMILVNTPGSWSHVYAPLLHADWHGCTPTDLVFPFFMFIIGSAMYFSFKKSEFAFTTTQAIKILKRGLIIFGIGLLLNWYPFNTNLDQLRILGVLQRIALAYTLAAFIVLLLPRVGIFVLSAAILVIYWLLLLSVGADSAFTLEQNLVRQWDIAILSEAHLWQGKGLAFDPEGLLSTLPAVVSVLFGFELTRYLSSFERKEGSAIKLVLIGIITIIIALFLSNWMPINKSLWTSTFVLYTSGIACIVLAAFIWLIDVKSVETQIKPLYVYGTNPLFVYVLAGIWADTYTLIKVDNVNLGKWLYTQMTQFIEPTLASFIYALAHVTLFWFISKVLYQRNIFIKI